MKWIEHDSRERLYVDEKGKIVGSIYKKYFTDNKLWSVTVEKEKLGDYYGEEAAKQAVVDKYQNGLGVK